MESEVGSVAMTETTGPMLFIPGMQNANYHLLQP
jgi:hypothetical protein